MDKSIVLSKIIAIYLKNDFIVKKNGHLKMIYKCAGLSDYFEENEELLTPYTYNYSNGRTYENDCVTYDLFSGLDNTFSDLLVNGKDIEIGALLKELAVYIPMVLFDEDRSDDTEKYEKAFSKLSSLYNLMGYDLKKENETIEVIPFTGDITKKSQAGQMEYWLEHKFEGVYDSYESATDAYANNNYGACIESCRTVLTGIFSKYKDDPKSNWKRGIGVLTGDYDGSDLQSFKAAIDTTAKEDLASFFFENKYGSLKKSMMSDYGTHREEGTVEQPSKEDALMMYRMMQDIVLWIFQKHNDVD